MTTWTVKRMRTRDQGALPDVVERIHFECTVTEGASTGTYCGSTGIPAPDAGAFTAFASLDESTVLAWLASALGDEATTIEETARARALRAVASDQAPPFA